MCEGLPPPPEHRKIDGRRVRRQVMPVTQHTEIQVNRSSRGCLLVAIVCLTLWMLTMTDEYFLSTVSCTSRRGWSTRCEQLRTCVSRGVLNDDLIIWASYVGRLRRREMGERSLEILPSEHESSALPLLSGAPSKAQSSSLYSTNA